MRDNNQAYPHWNDLVHALKLAGSVAKIIDLKRADLDEQAKVPRHTCVYKEYELICVPTQTWDVLRTQRTGALDAALDSLGGQVVPPDFYLSSPVSSLFGSQHGSDDESQPGGSAGLGFVPGQSPTETLRDVLRNGMRKTQQRNNDRSKWKTLRDFVDERSIEDILDAIDTERSVLDVCRAAVFAPLSSSSCRTFWPQLRIILRLFWAPFLSYKIHFLLQAVYPP